MVKNPSSNAGDAGLIPGQGTKIPHAAGQLSLRATTIEPANSGARTPQRRACVPQQKTLHAATKIPHAAT